MNYVLVEYGKGVVKAYLVVLPADGLSIRSMDLSVETHIGLGVD